jgi:hypothetical protein
MDNYGNGRYKQLLLNITLVVEDAAQSHGAMQFKKQ